MTGAVALQRTEGWDELPWKAFERNVFRLQKRIYKTARRDDFKGVRNLQRLLLRSFSARCLAVRRVTQDNRGKRTAGKERQCGKNSADGKVTFPARPDSSSRKIKRT